MPGLRSLLLVKVLEPEEGEDVAPAALNTVSLGSIVAVRESLVDFNTGPDGDADTPNVLYGPGVTISLPMGGADDPVNQLLVAINEDDIAWPVLIRMCAAFDWKMMDPKSGRTFG